MLFLWYEAPTNSKLVRYEREPEGPAHEMASLVKLTVMLLEELFLER